MAKERPLSETAQEVLDYLKGLNEPITMAEIKKDIPNVNPAHLTALRKRGLVVSEETEVEQVKVVKSKVLRYTAKGE